MHQIRRVNFIVLTLQNLVRSSYPYIMSDHVKKILSWAIKTIIFIAAYLYIYMELFAGKKWKDMSVFFHNIEIDPYGVFLLLFIVLLMPVNWSIETFKWQFSLRPIARVNFQTALKSVLTGVAIGSFTPWRIGDLVGRAFSLHNVKATYAILLSVICNLSQLFSTAFWGLLSGCFSVMVLPLPEILNYPPMLNHFFITLSIVLIILSTLCYLRLPFWTKVLENTLKRWWKNVSSYQKLLKKFHSWDLGKLCLMSLARHVVFTSQFVLLLYLFNLHIPFLHSFMMVSLIYFIMAAIPSFALADLGIRGSVSLFIFSTYLNIQGIDIPHASWIIFTVSSLIWIINLLFPAIFGSFFIFRLRFFNQKNNKDLHMPSLS